MLWGGRRGHGNFVAASNTDFRKFLDRNVSFTSAPRHFDNRRQLAAYAVYVAGPKGSNPPSSSGASVARGGRGLCRSRCAPARYASPTGVTERRVVHDARGPVDTTGVVERPLRG